MAKKSTQRASTSTQEKAKQMREQQRKADLRTRNTIIAVVSVLVIALVVAIIVVIVNRPTDSSDSSALPAGFQNGEPIVVSSNGVGETNPDAPDLYLYFDYSCSACADVENRLQPSLGEGATSGDYNLLLQPVITTGMPYNAAATAASLVVAEQAPDKLLLLHDAFLAFFLEAVTNQDGSVVQDASKSAEKVAEIASGLGISAEIIETFNPSAAEAYLTQTTNTWVANEPVGREQPATPEFVMNNTHLPLSGGTNEELFSSLLNGIAAVK